MLWSFGSKKALGASLIVCYKGKDMGAKTLISEKGWSEARKAYEHGASPSTITEKFGVTKEALKKRKLREGWRTITAARQEVEAMERERERSLGLSPIVPSGVEVAGEQLLRNGETSSLLASNLALSLLKSATADTLKPLADIADVSTSLKVARLAAGMDKQSTQVNVMVGGMFSQSQGEGLTLDVDTSEQG